MNKRQLVKPTTDPKILDYLSKDKDWGVRYWVVRNPNTTPETLKQMSINEKHNYVKDYIKNNPNCSEETKRYLLAVEVVEDIICNVEGKIQY
jgi:hypothetical protein